MKYTVTGLMVLLLIFTGCAGPKKEELPTTLFYPAPPELPRLQWLTSFNGAREVEKEKSGFESFVTGEKESLQRLDKPYGVAAYNGKVYVCDVNLTVLVFDFVKRTYSVLEGAKGLGKLVQPVNISIDKDGNKYVSDPVRGQVVVFDKNDFYIKAFGTAGAWKPVDAVVNEDRLYVADMKKGEVAVLDKDTGDVLKTIGNSSNSAERLFMPTNLAFDRDGILYVSDTGKFGVVKYDRDGHFMGSIGKLGTSVGTFARPKGIAIDRENRLYVVDAAFDNVQLLTSKGQPLTFFGAWVNAGKDPGTLYLPAKVAVNYDSVKYFERYADPGFQIEYLVFVTSQFGDRMVSVYGFGKEKGKKYPTDEELTKQLEDKLEKIRKEQPQKPAEDEKSKQ